MSHKSKKKDSTQWEKGYLAAVANIIRTHGADVIAKDVLRSIQPVNPAHHAPDNIAVLKDARVL